MSQLHSFLGLVNYYRKVSTQALEHISASAQATPEKEKLGLGSRAAEGFSGSQETNDITCLLVHFDPDCELVLACDASSYRVGAMLLYCMDIE